MVSLRFFGGGVVECTALMVFLLLARRMWGVQGFKMEAMELG